MDEVCIAVARFFGRIIGFPDTETRCRDNCSCAECVNPVTRQRSFDILAVSSSPDPMSRLLYDSL